MDWRICSWVCVMFFALQLDRGNISNALADNLLKDLRLTTNDYNLGMTIFYVCFLCAELPSQIISKKLGPDVWVPAQMVLWSIVAMLQCVIRGRTGFFITRGFLGAFEGGFIPDAILYLSYFYDSRELPIRVSYFYTASNLTPIISAFLAYGILHLRGIGGWEGWRWLFALEGGLTAVIGVISWFYLPPSPTQTAGWLRGKDGWFNEREEVIMVNRILRDDPSKVCCPFIHLFISSSARCLCISILTLSPRAACTTARASQCRSSGRPSRTTTSGPSTCSASRC